MKKSRQPTPRLQQLLEIADDCETATEAARRLGITRERVRQLCLQAGITKWQKGRLEKKVCPICGKVFKPKLQRTKTCSAKCGNKLMGITNTSPVWVERVCESCGKTFKRRPRNINRNSPGRFCSTRCLFKWIGTTYGFGKKA